MAVVLDRCSRMWVKIGAHACWRVQRALDAAGIEYGVVQGSSGKAARDALEGLSGERRYPVIEFEDGKAYRAQAKQMAATIAAGQLDSKR